MNNNFKISTKINNKYVNIKGKVYYTINNLELYNNKFSTNNLFLNYFNHLMYYELYKNNYKKIENNIKESINNNYINYGFTIDKIYFNKSYNKLIIILICIIFLFFIFLIDRIW